MIDKIRSGIVGIINGDRQGAGIIVRKDGMILTGAPLIKPSNGNKQGGELTVTLDVNGNKQKMPATLVGYDNEMMLGLIKINYPGDLPVPDALAAQNVHVGDRAISVSYYRGLRFTQGIISRKDNVLGELASDAPNSNYGPLLNSDGKVTGMTVGHYNDKNDLTQSVMADVFPAAMHAILDHQKVRPLKIREEPIPDRQDRACVEDSGIIVQRVSPALVSLYIQEDNGKRWPMPGVVISSGGLVVTGKPFFDLNGKVRNSMIVAVGKKDLPATLVGASNERDIAVYKIENTSGNDLPHIEFDAAPLSVKGGQRVVLVEKVNKVTAFEWILAGPAQMRATIANKQDDKNKLNFVQMSGVSGAAEQGAVVIDLCGQPVGFNNLAALKDIFAAQTPPQYVANGAGVAFSTPAPDVAEVVKQILPAARPTVSKRTQQVTAIPQ